LSGFSPFQEIIITEIANLSESKTYITKQKVHGDLEVGVQQSNIHHVHLSLLMQNSPIYGASRRLE
jgi:hypothetical protein